MAECRTALRLNPDLAAAHNNLGAALCNQGKLGEAIAECRAALRLKPDIAEAHAIIATALRDQGKLGEAAAEFRKARDLAPANTQVRQRIEQELSLTERRAALAARLPAMLRGEDAPRNAAERFEFGSLCYNPKRFSASARLFAEAFQTEPKLAVDMNVQNRYNAACSAALAAAGQGKDEPAPDEPARARWRKQAIDWLRGDLAFWTKQVETGPPQARQFVAQTLQHWKVDPDLAGIRDAAEVAKLPEAEQKVCRALWTEVDAVVAKASRKGKP